MAEPEEKVLITCPKCKGAADPLAGACKACGGSGKLLLKKITRSKKREDPTRNWVEELKRRGLWG